MWEHEHSGETTASPDAVWKVLADLDNWPAWDTSMEWVKLHGNFGVGAEVVMKPKGQEPVTSVIIEATPGRVYADQCEFGGSILRFSHTLEPLTNGGTRVIHRLTITGANADEIGPAIAEDFPEAMNGLLSCASA